MNEALQLIGTLRGHSSTVTAFDIIDDGEKYLIVSADQTGSLICWDLGQRRLVQKACIPLQENDVPLSLNHYEDDGSFMIILQLKSGKVFLMKLMEDYRLESVADYEFGSFTFFQIPAPYDDMLLLPNAINSEHLSVARINKSNIEETDIVLMPSRVCGMCMCGRIVVDRIVVGYDDGSISIYDKNTGSELVNWQVFKESIMAASCSIVDKNVLGIACVGAGDQLRLVRVEMETGRLIDSRHVVREREGTGSVVLQPDCLAVGGWDGMLYLFDTTTVELKGRTLGHSNGITACSVNEFPRGIPSLVRPSLRYKRLLLTASKDNLINLWDIQ